MLVNEGTVGELKSAAKALLRRLMEDWEKRK